MIQNRGLAIFKLRMPNHAKRQKLEQLQTSFDQVIGDGAQAVLDAGIHQPGEIHALVYPLARQAGLPSMHARLAVNEVTALERKTHRKGQSMPSKRGGLGLPANSYRLVHKHDRWAIRMTLGDRSGVLWLPLLVPQKLSNRLEQAQGDARLFQRKGDWYVALPFQIHRQVNPPILSGDVPAVTGVDLGIARLVTAYVNGSVLIVRGESLVQRRQRLAVRRQKAVQNHQPVQAARLKLLERRWVGSINHRIASQLVGLAASHPHPVIALEKLDGLLYRRHRSRRFSQMRQAWDFRQLIDLIVYKAREKDVQVVWVDPRGTSTTCPRCRLNSAGNATPNGRFHCQKCGYASITDIVAARNIAARCVQA